MSETTMPTHSAIQNAEVSGVTSNTCDTLSGMAEKGDSVRVYESLFEGHALQVEHVDAIIRKPVENYDWVFGIILALVLLIFVYLRNYRIPLTELVKAAFDSRVRERILREKNLSHKSSMIPIAAIYIGTISLVGFYAISRYVDFIEARNVVILGVTILSVTLIQMLQNALTYFFGATFQCPEGSIEYHTNNYLFKLMASIVLLPLILMLFFAQTESEIFLYIVLATIGVFMVLRIMRGAQIILTISNGSKFYLFYYLCTLELAPLLALAKGIKCYILDC